jgi:hypothetical protein
MIVFTVAAVGASSALAAGADNVRILLPRHPQAGQAVTITFAGRDSAPASALGARIDALLEPPKPAGATVCRSDIALTEQNHPGYIELLLHHAVDPAHHHSFRVRVTTPRLTKSGRWRVCTWEYNNEGISSTSSPASRAFSTMIVSRKG